MITFNQILCYYKQVTKQNLIISKGETLETYGYAYIHIQTCLSQETE